MFQDHPHSPFPDFDWIPLRCVVHDSILSKVGASRKAGAVQYMMDAHTSPLPKMFPLPTKVPSEQQLSVG